MNRIAFAALFTAAALGVGSGSLLAQTTKSIEDAPGYRTVPESDPAAAGSGLNVPPGGASFGDSTLVIQEPGGAPSAVQPGAPQPAGSAPAMQPPPAASFTPRQLAAFAETAVQVQTVAQLWQPLIGDAISTAEATNLSQQANAEKIRAIEDLGLIDPETYTRINEAARRDPALRGKIEGLYEAAAQRLPRGDAS